MAEAETTKLTTNPQPQIQATPTGKKKRTFLKSIIWMLFFLAFFATIAFAIYDYASRGSVKLPEIQEKKVEEVIVRENPEFETPPLEDNMPELGPPVPQPAIMEAPASDTFKQELGELNAKISELSQQNKNIMIYFLARDLKDSINDKTAFSTELQAFSAAVGENQEIGGRIEILRQSIASGYEEPAKLKDELKTLGKKVEQANRKGFTDTIGNAFGELVKVSKISGEVNKGDYESILKRAEITLSKDNITAPELERSIREVSTLGAPVQPWVQKANNLQRIIDVTDYLVDYSKNKVTGL